MQNCVCKGAAQDLCVQQVNKYDNARYARAQV